MKKFIFLAVILFSGFAKAQYQEPWLVSQSGNVTCDPLTLRSGITFVGSNTNNWSVGFAPPITSGENCFLSLGPTLFSKDALMSYGPGSTDNAYLACDGQYTASIVWFANTHVNIGTTFSDQGFQLYVGGTEKVTGAVTFSSTVNGNTIATGSGTISALNIQTGTLSSGTSTKTVPAGCHPWVQDNATSLTNVGTLTVTVSGTTATITSTNVLDASPYTLFNAGSQ